MDSHNLIKIFNFKFEYFSFLIYVLFFLFIPFSPHFTFFLSVMLLMTKYSELKYVRNTVILIALVMILFTAVSRQIGVSSSDDLINTYMPIYNSQAWGKGIFSTDLGIEIGYVVYVNIINIFIYNLVPREVLFYSMLGTLVLYYIWIIYFLLPKIAPKYQGIISAIALLAIQVGMLSQFLRQELATPIILMSLFYLSENAKKKSFILLFLSTLVHSSSLIIYFVFYSLTIIKGKYRILILCLLTVFSLMVFKSPGAVSSALTGIHLDFIAKKVAYYEVSKSLELFQALSIGKFYFLIILIFLTFKKYYNEDRQKSVFNDKMLTFCFWGCVFNLSFLILPNAARLFLIIPGFLMPVVVYPIIQRRLLAVNAIVFIYATVGLFFPQRLFAGGTDGFYLWGFYDFFNEIPFYYIFDFFNIK